MRLHTNVIGYTQTIRNALKAEQAAGRIAPHVSFKTLEQRGSRTHTFAYEVQLEADIRDNGRRAGNSGSFGAMRAEVDGYAATYDEWGWLIAALYAIDADALWGSVKYPQYLDAAHFQERTGWSYNPHAVIFALENGHGDPAPFISARTPEQVGRIGYGRISEDSAPPYFRREREAAVANPGKRKGEWLHYMPRTVESVRAFARLNASLTVAR